MAGRVVQIDASAATSPLIPFFFNSRRERASARSTHLFCPGIGNSA